MVMAIITNYFAKKPHPEEPIPQMPRLNNRAFENSPFIFAGEKTVNGRIIYKYLFENCGESTLADAERTVQILLADNQYLCATFPLESSALKSELVKKKYLTINGDAVCLSEERQAPISARADLTDKYFSEALLQLPTRCTQGHWLEKSSAEYWIRNKGDKCPAGPHSIGELKVDIDQQNEINAFLKNETNNKAIIKEQARLNRRAQLLSLARNVKPELANAQIDGSNNLNLDPPVTGAKIILKIGGKKIILTAAKQIMKQSGKEAAKAAGKQLVRYIPFVSLGVGLVSAAYRLTQGQYLRAGGEVVSGAVACIPIYGIPLSATIDVLNLTLNQNKRTSDEPPSFSASIDLPTAYKVLGFHPNSVPAQQEVDQRYNELRELIEQEETSEEEFKKQMIEILVAIKDLIYEKNRWGLKSKL